MLLLLLALQDVDVWTKARVRDVAGDAKEHTIHAYYVSSPESPDGRRVLFYTSTDPAGHSGEIRVLERGSGGVKTLASNVTVEDAHRAACQQWISGGRRIAYHDFRGGEWVVAAVDVETGAERVLAKGRQLGFGAPAGDVVPLYAPHGHPGERRDLELLNVETGEIRTSLTAAALRAAYPEWIAKAFGERPISIFFPVLSPDGARAFFKLATPSPAGLDPRTPESFRRSASERKGLLCVELEGAKPTFKAPREWGHPAWHPDGRRILEINHQLIELSGEAKTIPNLPKLKGGPHPSMHPAGGLFVTDFTETPGLWPLLVGDVRGERHGIVTTVDYRRGATSWRRGHPHPVFSPDGRRLYFNSGAGPWSRLLVAEID